MTNSQANSKPKPCSLKLLSLNVRGLSNYRKCRAIFTWCRKKVDLLFLQETHSQKILRINGRKNGVPTLSFRTDILYARGVAVLIRNELIDIVNGLNPGIIS